MRRRRNRGPRRSRRRNIRERSKKRITESELRKIVREEARKLFLGEAELEDMYYTVEFVGGSEPVFSLVQDVEYEEAAEAIANFEEPYNTVVSAESDEGEYYEMNGEEFLEDPDALLQNEV